MAELATYIPDQVVVTVAGITLEGFGESSIIRIEPADDAWKAKVGVDGQVSRSRSNNRMARVTVTLMATSKSNAALSALYNLDRNSPNGAGVGAFQVRDLQGMSLNRADECWIARLPTVEYGGEVSEREWQFDVAELEFGEAGN